MANIKTDKKHHEDEYGKRVAWDAHGYHILVSAHQNTQGFPYTWDYSIRPETGGYVEAARGRLYEFDFETAQDAAEAMAKALEGKRRK